MRTNIALDEDLVDEALKVSGAKTKRELVHQALKEFIESRKRLDLRELAEKIKFAPKYDYKKLRERQ